MPQKLRLHNDCGPTRDGHDQLEQLCTAIQPLWLNLFVGAQPSHLPQNPCNQNDTRLKICIYRGPTVNQSGYVIKRTQTCMVIRMVYQKYLVKQRAQVEEVLINNLLGGR